MKWNKLIAAILCAALTLTLLPAVALAEEAKVGKLVSATGEVYFVKGDTMEVAAKGASLYAGITVMTGESSNARLDLGKGRYATLDERSAVRLTISEGTLITEHLAGNVFHNIVKKQKKNAYAIKMNVLTLSVLGTTFFTLSPNIEGSTPPTGGTDGSEFQGSALLLGGELDVGVQGEILASMIPGDGLTFNFNGNTAEDGMGALRVYPIEQEAITNMGPFMLGEAAGALGVNSGDTEGGNASAVRRRALEERGTVPATKPGGNNGVRFIIKGNDVYVVPIGQGEDEMGYEPFQPPSTWYPDTALGSLNAVLAASDNVSWSRMGDGSIVARFFTTDASVQYNILYRPDGESEWTVACEGVSQYTDPGVDSDGSSPITGTYYYEYVFTQALGDTAEVAVVRMTTEATDDTYADVIDGAAVRVSDILNAEDITPPVALAVSMEYGSNEPAGEAVSEAAFISEDDRITPPSESIELALQCDVAPVLGEEAEEKPLRQLWLYVPDKVDTGIVEGLLMQAGGSFQASGIFSEALAHWVLTWANGASGKGGDGGELTLDLANGFESILVYFDPELDENDNVVQTVSTDGVTINAPVAYYIENVPEETPLDPG